jgi:hypothetical protein
MALSWPNRPCALAQRPLIGTSSHSQRLPQPAFAARICCTAVEVRSWHEDFRRGAQKAAAFGAVRPHRRPGGLPESGLMTRCGHRLGKILHCGEPLTGPCQSVMLSWNPWPGAADATRSTETARVRRAGAAARLGSASWGRPSITRWLERNYQQKEGYR